MIVTFVCPSAPHPVGGVTALYEFANGLSRRGHQVHLLHAPFFRNRITSLDDLSWFTFDPGVAHRIVAGADSELPQADIIFGDSPSPECGLPATLIQGFQMLHLGLEREAFRTPGLKVCISHWLIDVGERFGVARDQCEVVAMGIDQDRYRLTALIDERPPQVGMLHSTHPAKRSDLGWRALEEARAQVPELQAAVFGTGAWLGSLPEGVSYTRDPSPEHLVEGIYNRCRIFVQPSDYEGFGFTAVEAMACGAALVTTDNGGSRDYATDDVTAVVVPPGDEHALADAVLGLLDDDDRRVRLARAGHDLVSGRFRWDRAAADLEASLLRYLADPAAYQRPPGDELVPSSQGTDPFALR